MLFARPSTSKVLATKLEELDGLHERLAAAVTHAGPWIAGLRRQIRELAVTSSVSIEGFVAPEDRAAGAIVRDTAADPADVGRQAVACYGRAMDHVAVLGQDPGFRWLDRVLLDLHFDACAFQRDRTPGRWRTGPASVVAPGGGIAYEGPPAADVPALMEEVVDWLDHGDFDAHPVVRAAMAHLHLVSVQPFADGNGRVARLAHALMLARTGPLDPELTSIEEYLAGHVREYYGVLRAVQDGSYRPDRDPARWVEYCVDAHLVQARARTEQLRRAHLRWEFLEELVRRRDWPARLVVALEQSLSRGASRAGYAAEADVPLVTASGDLRRLVDHGLLVRHGRSRNVRYLAHDDLRHRISAVLALDA